MKIKDFTFERKGIKGLKPQFSHVTVNNKSSPTSETVIVNLSLVLLDLHSTIKAERSVQNDEL